MRKTLAPVQPTSLRSYAPLDVCYLTEDQPGNRGNRGYQWDDFDPLWYVDYHYRALHDDDLRIIQLVREHFGALADRPGSASRPLLRGIDVGAGPNLYPALTMLPLCREVTLWERGAQNLRWLNNQVSGYSPLWDKYWDALAYHQAYQRVEDPRTTLQRAARVRKGDLFFLPKKQWDVGTMFFVAESVSDREREFKVATKRFIESLKPGSPFVAAFMRDSTGYYVGKRRFPAVAVNEVDVEHALAPLANDLDVRVIRLGKMLRDGYCGMILAFGKAGKA